MRKILMRINQKSGNTNRICDGDINRVFLMSQKGAYSYEYMDSWRRFNDSPLPDKK